MLNILQQRHTWAVYSGVQKAFKNGIFTKDEYIKFSYQHISYASTIGQQWQKINFVKWQHVSPGAQLVKSKIADQQHVLRVQIEGPNAETKHKLNILLNLKHSVFLSQHMAR